MNYTLSQLNTLVKVAETRSITKAAEELHLTQPAVSIQLKNLQEQFELPLIEVLNKRVYVTEFGHEIIASAKRILSEIQTIDYKKHTFKGELTGSLTLSIVSTGQYVAPYFLAEFIKTNPGIKLNLQVTNKSEVIHSISNNECDFALVSILPENLPIEATTLLPNNLYVISNRKQGEDGQPAPISELAQLPLIFREPGSGTRQTMENFLAKHKLPVRNQLELTGNEAVKHAVMAGLGYSIMPLIGIQNELENGQLHILPTQGFPIKSAWRIIWLKNKQLTPVGKAYLAFLNQHKNSISQQVFQSHTPKVPLN